MNTKPFEVTGSALVPQATIPPAEAGVLQALSHALSGKGERGWLQLAAATEIGEQRFPTEGIVLWYLYEHDFNSTTANCWAEQLFLRIAAQHRYWYDHCDPGEEGLPAPNGVQQPLFLTLLTWSNECLIKTGHLLGVDVLPMLQWHELTIHSMNEKLWDAKGGGYHACETATGKWQPTTGLQRFLPLAGEIPTQEQAEQMLQCIEKTWRLLPINVWEGWLLYKGLKRYDFHQTAKRLRLFLLESANRPFEELTAENSGIAALYMDLRKQAL